MKPTAHMVFYRILLVEDPIEREQQFLKYLMSRRGITVKDVARELDVSPSLVYKALSMRRSLTMLDKIDSAITTITDDNDLLSSTV